MTKSNLIDAIAKNNGLTKAQAKDVVESVFETISSELTSGREVTIAGFGKFSVQERAARMGRNPKTGEPVQIAAKSVVKFKSYL